MEKPMEYREIPVDSIVVPEKRVRRVASERAMEELRRSIQERGVLVPILAEPTEQGFRVIAGVRRVMCARSLRLPLIPAILFSADREWQAWASFAENRVRESVNAYDEARYVFGLVKEWGKSQAEVAEALGVSESWVSQRLAILSWPENVKRGLVEGWLTYAVARELVGIRDEVELGEALKLAKSSGCTVRQAAEWRRAWERRVEGAAAVSVGGGGRGGREGLRDGEVRCGLCESVWRESEVEDVKVCGRCMRIIRDAMK